MAPPPHSRATTARRTSACVRECPRRPGGAAWSDSPTPCALTPGRAGSRLNPDEIGRNSPARRLPRRGPPGNSDPREDPTLTTRASFHGSGAVAFSTKGEYGVRLMVQLGRRYGTGPASLAEIAADEDLPRAYLEQLVTSLRDAGLVVSTRGARGGYELARATRRDPDERGPPRPRGPHRADDLRLGRAGPRHLRPLDAVHGERALDPRPRRDHRHARRHDPRGPRPGPPHHPRSAGAGPVPGRHRGGAIHPPAATLTGATS